MHTRIRAALAAVVLTAALAGPGVVAGTAQAASSGCYITASAVNIRSTPSSHSTAVGVAYKGQTCKATDYSNGWDKVKMKGTGNAGWVRSDLVHTPDDDTHTCIPEDEACHG
ncbi:SH3 domain-containing protein [Streptomyces malaysiensis]|uniref:SH3 domain-containing protein n=1 Tax=Streptomyces malaysiensis TaxID=92644 RepID=UPI00135661B0|nr:SH3 domain-containing protein [Streptomyces sp. SPMA113]